MGGSGCGDGDGGGGRGGSPPRRAVTLPCVILFPKPEALSLSAF